LYGQVDGFGNGHGVYDGEPDATWKKIFMTLRIALACQEDERPRIVLCTDWKSSSALGASQTADKLRWIKRKPLWLTLTAGEQRAIESVVRYYRQHLENETITDATAQRIFDRYARWQLARRKSHAVSGTSELLTVNFVPI
jgi:hypothetical protein